MVDGVDDAVESNELRNCCVDESETVRRESFLLIFEFCSLAMYTARKQKSIDEHNSSASFRSFRRKIINSTVDALSLVETRKISFFFKENYRFNAERDHISLTQYDHLHIQHNNKR